MSIRGRWRIVEMPDYQRDYPDMVEPAYILFDKSGGEFAFGCLTGAIQGTAGGNAVAFTWSGCDEMHEVSGEGWAEIREDGALEGEISFLNGDDAIFIARRRDSFSTAC